MRVILKINNTLMSREKSEYLRDMVVEDLKEKGVAVVPYFVDVYIVESDKAEVKYETN